MSKMIPVEVSFAEWCKDPNYVEAYDALEDEYSLAAALIEARARAGLTQPQPADRTSTPHALSARLERGGQSPPPRTVDRVAAETGMRLRISFEPMPAK